MNLNKVLIIGRVVRDPELKALSTGMRVCGLSMATNRTWKGKDGQKKESTEFHNIVAFGRTAETIGQYVKKGQLLYIEGRLQTRTWEDKKSGEKKYRTEIIVDTFQFGPKPQTSAAVKPVPARVAAPVTDPAAPDDMEFPTDDVNPDDIPF